MAACSKLIVGLGNPGVGYALTRHNAGFWLLDAVAAQAQAQFVRKRKFNAMLAIIGDLYLLQPQTWMNNSGESVAAVAAFYNVPLGNILVAHDEVDLPLGRIKLKFGGGTAGHNGLADITRRLGSSDYWRIRIGVGKPPVGGVHDYVLAVPPQEEMQTIKAEIDTVLAVWSDIACGDYERAMLALHTVK